MNRRSWFVPAFLLLVPALVARAAEKDQYGDPLPEGAKARIGTARLRLETFSPPVLSPDGKTLHAVTNFTTPRFDPISGEQVGKLSRAFSGSIADISADGNRLVQIAFGGVTVWDVAADKQIAKTQQRTLPTFNPELAVSLSGDGKTLALGTTGAKTSVQIWDVDKDKEAKTIDTPFNQSVNVAISADGKTIATFGAHTDPENKGFVDPEKNLNRYAIFYDVASGKELSRFRSSGYSTQSALFAPDGSVVAVSNGNSAIDLVDPKTGKSKQTLLGRTRMGRWLAFSPDGATLASTGDEGAVRRWKVSDGSILSTTDAPVQNLYYARVRLLDNEKGMAWSTKGSAVIVWEVPSGKLLSPAGGHTHPVRGVLVSPDNKFVITSSDDGTAQKWELETGKSTGPVLVRPLNTTYSTTPFVNPDLTRAMTRDYSGFALYDIATNTQQYVIPWQPDGYSSGTFTPDGSKVVVVTGGNTFRKAPAHVAVWDVKTGKRLIDLDLPGQGAAGAAVTPDGKYLVTAVGKPAEKGPGDVIVTGWELATGAKKGEHTEEGGYAYPQVACASDNKTAAVITSKNKLVAFDFIAGKVTKTHDTKQHQPGGVLVFSADGKMLAVAGAAAPFADDRPAPVLVIDWASGDIKHTFSAKGGMPNSMVFSPNGKYLVTGSGDTTATVWSLEK